MSATTIPDCLKRDPVPGDCEGAILDMTGHTRLIRNPNNTRRQQRRAG